MNKGYFIKEAELRFCDCDYKKRAKLSTIMSIMADIAGNAYADKGYSHTWLWDNHFVFLLSRVSLHIKRVPKADEIISVHTWEQGTKGVLFVRMFAVYDESDQIIMEAQTQWVLADPYSRAILRPSAFTGEMNFHKDKIVNTLDCGKLKVPEELSKCSERKISYSDIDANGHVYNAVYASIACDCLSKEEIDQDIVDFRINFKKEAMLGEIMQIYKYSESKKTYILGFIDDNLSFECEFTF